MKIKTKLLSLIISLVFFTTFLLVGVFAALDTNFPVSGSITFTPSNVKATISNAQTSGLTLNKSLSNIVITDNETSEELENKCTSWNSINASLNENESSISFSITNDKSTSARFPFMRVEVNATSSTKTADIYIQNDKGGKAIYLAPGDTANFTINIHANNISNLSLSNFEIDFELEKMMTTPTESNIQLLFDQTGGYYYVEMGTYNSSPVKWRLTSFDGVSKFKATSSVPPKMYTPVSGDTEAYQNAIFIQETYANITKAFDSTNCSNDYSTSELRSYLKGTTNTSDGTSLYGDFAISSNADHQKIYNKIVARSINDLHTEIGWYWDQDGVLDSGDHPAQANEVYTMTPALPSATKTDKFWAMSIKEIYTLVFGKRVIKMQNSSGEDYKTVPISWPGSANRLLWNDVKYSLRSPVSDLTYRSFIISEKGVAFNCHDVDLISVRASFVLNF